MNRETIIKMAREAGFPDWWISPPEPERQDGNALDMLAIFIELAKAEEREECAKVCESAAWVTSIDEWRDMTKKDVADKSMHACATAIRARGEDAK